MKKIYFLAIAVLLSLGFASCSEDNPSDESIFPNKPVQRDNFDKWLLTNYTYPYNIDFKYKMEDIYSDMKYHLVPADSAKSAKLAIIAKYLWFDAYAECVGSNFVKENVPRVIHLIGSAAYNSGEGTMVLGTAEGGLVITLYMVNRLTDKTLKDYATMNEYYFHTMHHEFTHILNQLKPYDSQYDRITESDYVSGNWYGKSPRVAHRLGFVSPYAMDQGREDFAEMLSYYVTLSESEWNDILQDAGTKGASLIKQKLEMVRSYMSASWNVDIDELRTAVLRRAGQIEKLDLTTLK